MSDETTTNHAAFIWSVADLLRGVYKQSEYGRVILPLTVLRRLDCVLEPTKVNVLAIVGKLPASLENRAPVLAHAAGQSFYNTSKHTFTTLLADPDNVAGICVTTLRGFPSRPATSSTSSTSILRSHVSPTTTCCIWWFRSSPTLTCVRQCFEPGDGLHIRGVDPPLLGAVQRDGGGALHTP